MYSRTWLRSGVTARSSAIVFWSTGCCTEGAISAKGKTVAVFGTGVDVIYPKENSRLSEQILALGGALISEFPLGTFAAP